MGTSKSCGCLKEDLNKARKLSQEQLKLNKAVAAAIKDKTPKRREQKRLTQMKYVVSDKAILAHFRRWLKKKKKIGTAITDSEYLEFRKRPCSSCGKKIEGLGIGFQLTESRKAIQLSNFTPMCGVCKLIKPKRDFNPITFAKAVLRRYWKKTPMASLAMQKAKRDRGLYECASCKELFGCKEVQIDHRIPVISVEDGFQNLDTFVTRLLCDDSNLDVLCKLCHSTKTTRENIERERLKKEKKI